MKTFRSLFLMTFPLLALTGCDSEVSDLQSNVEALGDEKYELQLRVEELESKLASAKDEAEEAVSLAGDLTDKLRRFDHDDWEYVVPQIKSLADDLESAVQDVDYKLE